MKEWFLFGLVFLCLLAPVGGSEDNIIEISENGQCVAFQGETIILLVRSETINSEGTFDIELAEDFQRFDCNVYQDDDDEVFDPSKDRKLKNLESNENKYKSGTIGRSQKGKFYFEIDIGDITPGMYLLKIVFIESDNVNEKYEVPFNLIVLQPWSKIRNYISISSSSEKGEEVVEKFIFPDQECNIIITSPEIAKKGEFIITVKADQGVECTVFEIIDSNEDEIQGEKRYTSTTVEEGQTRDFLFKIKVLPDIEGESASLNITIHEKNNENEKPKKYKYIIHILPAPKETIEGFVEDIYNAMKPSETPPPNGKPEEKPSEYPSRYLGIALIFLIPLTLIFIYQRKIISELKKENKRLKTKIDADHDTLKKIMEKL
ncbi:MAG: hypothetical protein PVF58_14005 [Candidatus Methanofastidiosia archaeon]|jgi:hypothetical protein